MKNIHQYTKEVGDSCMQIYSKKILGIVLCVLFLSLMVCIIKIRSDIDSKENITNNNERDMGIIEYNVEKLQTVFLKASNPMESAMVLSKNLTKVGAVRIEDVEVLKEEEHLIVLTVTDTAGCKFWISTDEFGDLGMIKQNDATGKLLLHPPEE